MGLHISSSCCAIWNGCTRVGVHHHNMNDTLATRRDWWPLDYKAIVIGIQSCSSAVTIYLAWYVRLQDVYISSPASGHGPSACLVSDMGRLSPPPQPSVRSTTRTRNEVPHTSRVPAFRRCQTLREPPRPIRCTCQTRSLKCRLSIAI